MSADATDQPAAPGSSRRLDDPTYRRAVLELLGLLAHGELQAYGRITSDAAEAPDLHGRVRLSELAVEEYRHFELLRGRLVDLGADPIEAMTPFVDVFDEFDARTTPGDWWERLVKAYVGYGIANDFYREIARLLDPQSRELVEEALLSPGHSEYVVSVLLQATAADERLSARLSLWGRRLVGEAVGLAQSALTRYPGLLYLLELGEAEGDVSASAIISRLMGEHTHRMERLGLTA